MQLYKKKFKKKEAYSNLLENKIFHKFTHYILINTKIYLYNRVYIININSNNYK